MLSSTYVGIFLAKIRFSLTKISVERLNVKSLILACLGFVSIYFLVFVQLERFSCELIRQQTFVEI